VSRFLIIGAHACADEVEPVAVPMAAGPVVLSAIEIADDQALGDRELLLRTVEVRRRLLDRATFIAVRYGFAPRSTEEAVRVCHPHLERWRELLQQHSGRVEVTLKIAASSTQERPQRSQFSSGADYLRALHASVHAADVSPEFREGVEQFLGTLAVERRWLRRDNRSIEVAFLVDKAKCETLMSAGEELKKGFSGVPFLLSGPWPLEVFAE
jgi:hypothetical protein